MAGSLSCSSIHSVNGMAYVGLNALRYPIDRIQNKKSASNQQHAITLYRFKSTQ